MARLRFLAYVLGGLALVAAVVAWVFYIQRGAHMELKGSVFKVRTLATDEASSVALIDFRVTNVADYVWLVRSVAVSVVDGQGNVVDGSTISDVDASRLFGYYPLLGQKYNSSLTLRTRIKPHETLDRMIGARFELPEGHLQARRNLIVRVTEVDGGVSDIAERPAK